MFKTNGVVASGSIFLLLGAAGAWASPPITPPAGDAAWNEIGTTTYMGMSDVEAPNDRAAESQGTRVETEYQLGSSPITKTEVDSWPGQSDHSGD
jgi:hypothetical protein